MTGARAFAEMMLNYGVSHIFFVPVCMAKTLAEMEDMPIRRVLVHGEKAAAYMADGYGRARHRRFVPGQRQQHHRMRRLETWWRRTPRVCVFAIGIGARNACAAHSVTPTSAAFT